jgi:hypothetical protein
MDVPSFYTLSHGNQRIAAEKRFHQPMPNGAFVRAQNLRE